MEYSSSNLVSLINFKITNHFNLINQQRNYTNVYYDSQNKEYAEKFLNFI